ncbi:MAG: zf-HC2 domain-containing protein [Gemmatirosa sp.]
MTDPRHPTGALPATDPRDDTAREARHVLLRDLLGAYADGELPAETASQIEAHLVGCAHCRLELDVHDALRQRLAAEPTPAAPAALRARIAAAVAAAPLAASPTLPAAVPRRAARRRVAIASAAMVLVALSAGGLAWRARLAPEPPLRVLAGAAIAVPLLRDVVADFRRVAAGDLPGRARDLDGVRAAVPFAVAPLQVAELRLLGAWTTDLAGEPAAVLAYRWDDRLLLQYIVSEERFFRAPAVRAAVAGGHHAGAADGARAVVAWPTAAAGVVVVSEVSLERLAAALSAARLAGRPDGGAH